MSLDFRKADSGLNGEASAIESPFLAGRQLGHMALSSPVTPVDLPSRWSFRRRERKSQFSCHSCLAIAFSTAAQPRGSGKWMASYALLWSLFILSKIFSGRDDNCPPSPAQSTGQKTKQKKHPLPGAWVWWISGWPWISKFHFLLHINSVNQVFKLIDSQHLLCFIPY